MRDKVKTRYAEQVQDQISKGIAPESVSVYLKISILKPRDPNSLIYTHLRTNEDIVKNGWRRFGVTKAIKENIRKDNPFENYIMLDLYLYGYDFKKISFDSSLIFIKVYQLIIVKVSLSFANDIF